MDDQDRSTVKRFIFGAIVVVLIVAAIWFFFVRPKQSPTSQTVDTAQQSGQNDPKQDPQPQSPAAPADGNQPGAQTSPAPSGQNGGQLANVGPGPTMLLFVSASATGAIAHHLYRRRFSASRTVEM